MVQDLEKYKSYLENLDLDDDSKIKVIKELEVIIGIILDEQLQYNKIL